MRSEKYRLFILNHLLFVKHMSKDLTLSLDTCINIISSLHLSTMKGKSYRAVIKNIDEKVYVEVSQHSFRDDEVKFIGELILNEFSTRLIGQFVFQRGYLFLFFGIFGLFLTLALALPLFFINGIHLKGILIFSIPILMSVSWIVLPFWDRHDLETYLLQQLENSAKNDVSTTDNSS